MATFHHIKQLILLLLVFCAVVYSRIQDPCLGDSPGVCLALKNCQVLREKVIRQRGNVLFLEELKRISKDCDFAHSEVCCPGVPIQQSALRLLTPADGCGLFAKHVSFQKVIGGKPPSLGSWPWIALLRYDEPSGMKWRCGGSIITKRHILTAAHCISNTLYSVRLGEHDLNSNTETQHVDIRIRKSVRHPEFSKQKKNNGRNDIAVLYLDEDIKFTDYIKPICLPIAADLRTKSLMEFVPYIAGWGITETSRNSNILLQAKIKFQDNKICESVQKKTQYDQPETGIDDAFICAGETSSDSCRGDSGGPLIVFKNVDRRHHTFLIGIVSSGLDCEPGPREPALYTRTAYFIEWIAERVSEPI